MNVASEIEWIKKLIEKKLNRRAISSHSTFVHVTKKAIHSDACYVKRFLVNRSH